MKTPAPIERFFLNVRKAPDGQCWEWLGWKNKGGYGVIFWENKNTRAHRVAWMIHKGAIPDGLHVLHTCDNRPCVNPDHLWLGTNLDNIRDRDRKKRTANARKTHCPQGHPYSEENTRIWGKNYRTCRTCDNARRKAFRKRTGK